MKNILKNPSFFGFVITFLFAFAGFMYYFYFIKKDNFYYLDNSSNKNTNVNLDNKQYNLLPNTFLKIKLDKGKHKIKLLNKEGNEIDTIFYTNDVNGIINPTFSDYYMYKKYYGYRKNKDSIALSLSKTKIDSIYYKGNIVHCHDLNIEGFDFGLDESFPKIIQRDSVNERIKVYRKEDFIKTYSQLN